MKTSELLRKAADVMKERGYCVGELEDKDGRVCALGAMYIAQFGTVDYTEYLQEGMYDTMCQVIPPTHGIASWSNAVGKDEVLKGFERGIAFAETTERMAK